MCVNGHDPVRKVISLDIQCKRGRGRPKQSPMKTSQNDMSHLGIESIMTLDRDE